MLGGYWFSVKESLIPSVPHQKFAAEFDAIWAASLCWRNALIGPLSRQFTALRSNPSDAVFYCTEFLTRDTSERGYFLADRFPGSHRVCRR